MNEAFKPGDGLAYSNQYGQRFYVTIVRTYHQYTIVQRKEWPSEESLDLLNGPYRYRHFPANQRNYRFWVWWNGQWTKLTLRPGQSLSVHEFHYHEEGWSRTSERWEHVGDGVYNEHSDEGKDCDGRLDRYSEWFCPARNLRARDMMDPDCPNQFSENIGIFAPEWEKVSASQRDQYAELAGY